MSLVCTVVPHLLQFRFSAGTSRGVLTSRNTWIIQVTDRITGKTGKGEAGPLAGLSVDDIPDFEVKLRQILHHFNALKIPFIEEAAIPALLDQLVPDELPSVRFGIEAALLDLSHGGEGIYFDNGFSRGTRALPMNGLIWMGDPGFMAEQIEAKLRQGYTTLKMKIGAVDFDEECRLLAAIRRRFTSAQITLRVDANGAFSPAEAPDKLKALAAFEIHSIEQPIRPGQWQAMAALISSSPVPVALDEELIGIHSPEAKRRLLDSLRPPYIILKPTLLGGFGRTKTWITLAEETGTGWWITSALESNVGLTAIAQFTAMFDDLLPQGLGTGQLYHNNFPSRLHAEGGFLSMTPPSDPGNSLA